MMKVHLQLTTQTLATALKKISNLTILMHSQMSPTVNISTVDIVSVVKRSIELDAMASLFISGNQVLPAIVQISGYDK